MTLECVNGEFTLPCLERMPGVWIERFGSAWGPCAPDRPELDFHNTVQRLLPNDVEQVPAHRGAVLRQPARASGSS